MCSDGGGGALAPALAVPTQPQQPQQQQQEAALAQAWLQAVAADPTALANMRAAVGARAAQATAEGSDPQAAQQHLVTALVRAIVETQASASHFSCAVS